MAVAVVDRLEQIHINNAQRQWSLMAQGATNFFFCHFAEMPAIAEIGQRIVDRQLIDFFVVAGLYAVVADELQNAFTHRNLIAIDQRLLVLKPCIIEAGGVGRTEVMQYIAVAIQPNFAMLPRYAFMCDLQIGLWGAANAYRQAPDIQTPPQSLAMDHHDAGRALRGAHRAIAIQRALGGLGLVVILAHADGSRGCSECSAC